MTAERHEHYYRVDGYCACGRERPQPAGPNVRKDPDNRRTVILDRWPTEEEKDGGVRDQIARVRRGA